MCLKQLNFWTTGLFSISTKRASCLPTYCFRSNPFSKIHPQILTRFRFQFLLYGKSYFPGKGIFYKLLGDGLEVITEWCECLRNGIHLGFLLFPLLSNVQPTLITLHQTWLNTVLYFAYFWTTDTLNLCLIDPRRPETRQSENLQ